MQTLRWFELELVAGLVGGVRLFAMISRKRSRAIMSTIRRRLITGLFVEDG
jgi:hypothetical protein